MEDASHQRSWNRTTHKHYRDRNETDIFGRATIGLHRLALYLESGKTFPEPKIEREATDRTKETEREVVRWYRRKLRTWDSAGRLTQDGYLRLNGAPKPWTAARVRKAFPSLTEKEAAEVVGLSERI